MKQIKTAQFESGVFVQAVIGTQGLESLEFSGAGKLTKDEVVGLSSWLNKEVLGLTQITAQPMGIIPVSNAEMESRRVAKPEFRGVEVFDKSKELSNKETVRFTVPGK